MTDAPTAEATAPDMSSLMTAIESTDFSQTQSTNPPVAEAPKPEPKAPKQEAAKPESPKKPWDVKAQEKVKDEPAQEEPVIEEAPAGMKPEAQTRWGALRKTEEAYKKIAPEYEALKKEVETLRNAPPQLPEEVQHELKELRQFRAAYDVEGTPEYREAVDVPFQKIDAELKELASYAKVDYDTLMKAVDIPGRLERSKAIRKVLSESTEDITETEILEAVNSATRLHGVYQKADEMRNKAKEMSQALEGDRKAQQMAADRKAAEAFKQASTQMRTILEDSLKNAGVFSNPEVTKALETATQAAIDKDPQMAAYQVQAGALLPALIDIMNKDRAELKEAKAQLAARAKALPGSGPTKAPERTAPVSSEDAMAELESLVAQGNRSHFAG